MAIYRNKVTGVVVDTPCKISGENWIRVTKNQQKKNEQEQAPVQGDENNQEPDDE